MCPRVSHEKSACVIIFVFLKDCFVFSCFFYSSLYLFTEDFLIMHLATVGQNVWLRSF